MSKLFPLQRHAIYVLAAAALFGASAPIAKLLLERMPAISLAALAYCGGGVALVCAWLIRGILAKSEATAATSRWTRAEGVSMAAAIVAGGVLAPTILFWSLAKLPAGNAALLLNFEGLLTALLAALIFHEAVGRRVWLAMALMIIAGGVLSAAGTAATLTMIPTLGVISRLRTLGT